MRASPAVQEVWTVSGPICGTVPFSGIASESFSLTPDEIQKEILEIKSNVFDIMGQHRTASERIRWRLTRDAKARAWIRVLARAMTCQQKHSAYTGKRVTYTSGFDADLGNSGRKKSRRLQANPPV